MNAHDNARRDGLDERTTPAHMPVILSSRNFHRRIPAGLVLGVDVLEEAVEELDPSGLVAFGGVVALAEEDGHEVGSGGEVDTGFADGLEAAVELDGAGAVAVAEQSAVHLEAEPAHALSLGGGGQDRGPWCRGLRPVR
jgi:hypothetical protein